MLKPAIFLDRDGILNEKKNDYVKNVEEINIILGTSDGLCLLKKMGYTLVIVTNQSVVNRGIISTSELNVINKFLLSYFQKNNCEIDALYYCPHTPEEKCSCRKPEIGLILSATKEFMIDLNSSWFIGDSESDILAGLNAGCNCIQVSGPYGLLRAAKLIHCIKNTENLGKMLVRLM